MGGFYHLIGYSFGEYVFSLDKKRLGALGLCLADCETPENTQESMGAGTGDNDGGDTDLEPQLRAQFEDLRKSMEQRSELRHSNCEEEVARLRNDIAKGTIKLKSDIKKSSAFVKKLKLLTENSADALMKDVKEINLTRYVSECVASLVEAPLKMVDLPAAVRVISLLHQRYAEFSSLLIQTLVTTFDASYGTDDKSKLVKRRILLRLLSELYLAGVITDVHVVSHIIQRVAKREGGPSGGSKTRGKGNMSMTGASHSNQSSAQLEVPLLVNFAKSVGVEFLGVLPKKYKKMMDVFGDECINVMQPQLELVPLSIQTQCLSDFQEAYELI